MSYKLPSPLPGTISLTYTVKGVQKTKTFVLCTPQSAAALTLANGTNAEGWFYYVPEGALEIGDSKRPLEGIGTRRHFSLFRGWGPVDKSKGFAKGASVHLSLKPRVSSGATQKGRSYSVYYNYESAEKWNNRTQTMLTHAEGFGGPSWANGDARAAKARAVLEAFVRRLDAMATGGGGVTTPVSLMSTPLTTSLPPSIKATATVKTETKVFKTNDVDDWEALEEVED